MIDQDLQHDDRHRVKDHILCSLQKLNDRDTQRTGTDELHDIFLNLLDADSLSFVVSAVCQVGPESKPWARKETCRLLSILTDSDRCPHADSIFHSSSLMAKVCSCLRHRMGDRDGGVRDATAEITAIIARNYHKLHSAPLPGTATNIIMRVILDGLQAHQRELQCAAASALCQMSPHIGPLDPVVSKQLIRYLSLTNFHAKPHLLQAFALASPDSSQVHGLITLGLEGISPVLGSLIGSPVRPGATSGTGCLGCLGNSDWATRKAAAETLSSLASALGPTLDDGISGDKRRIPRSIESLGKAKHDRVKPVRAAVADSLSLLTDLHNWMDTTTAPTLPQWRSYVRKRPANSAVTIKRSVSPTLSHSARGSRFGTPDTVPSQIPSSMSRSMPSGTIGRASIRASTACAAFVANAARGGDMVKVREAGNFASQLDLAGLQEDSSPTLIQAMSRDEVSGEQKWHQQHVDACPPDEFLSDRENQSSESPVKMHRTWSPPHPLATPLVISTAKQVSPSQPPSSNSRNSVNMRNSFSELNPCIDYESPQATSVGMQWQDIKPSPQPNGTLTPVQRSASRELFDNNASDTLPRQTTASSRCDRRSSGSRTNHDPAIAALSEQSRRLIHMMSRLTEHVTSALESLETRVSSLESGAAASRSFSRAASWHQAQQLRAPGIDNTNIDTTHPPQSTIHTNPIFAGEVASRDTPDIPEEDTGDLPSEDGANGHLQVIPQRSMLDLSSSSFNEPNGRPAVDSEFGTINEEPSKAAAESSPNIKEEESLYRLALMSESDQLHMLRLMQRTGPVWEALSTSTAHLLLSRICEWLRAGAVLPRLLPWLYRLADEDNLIIQNMFGQVERQEVLTAVLAARSLASFDVTNKYSVLYDTLLAVWGPLTEGTDPHFPDKIGSQDLCDSLRLDPSFMSADLVNGGEPLSSLRNLKVSLDAFSCIGQA